MFSRIPQRRTHSTNLTPLVMARDWLLICNGVDLIAISAEVSGSTDRTYFDIVPYRTYSIK